jgi:tripartite-type tricarboxylate transporter receptor subunit TctC
MLVGFGAGGAIDVIARMLVEGMKGYSASFIVDNRPGAGGRLALEALKNSSADGTVMVLTPASTKRSATTLSGISSRSRRCVPFRS